MNKLALLAELPALAETAPSFDLRDPSSQIQQSWLGRVHALLAKWNMEEANTFRTATDVMGVELRESDGLHDRIVCIEGRSCWVSGQPMKISVRTKQSYLAPLAAEVAELKLNYYQEVWGSAAEVGKD
jgi:hypothetical protein